MRRRLEPGLRRCRQRQPAGWCPGGCVRETCLTNVAHWCALTWVAPCLPRASAASLARSLYLVAQSSALQQPAASSEARYNKTPGHSTPSTHATHARAVVDAQLGHHSGDDGPPPLRPTLVMDARGNGQATPERACGCTHSTHRVLRDGLRQHRQFSIGPRHEGRGRFRSCSFGRRLVMASRATTRRRTGQKGMRDAWRRGRRAPSQRAAPPSDGGVCHAPRPCAASRRGPQWAAGYLGLPEACHTAPGAPPWSTIAQRSR